MQEQSFEENVRREMQELAFVPSNPVWAKVEARIKEKKKRRRLIIFWLLALLLPGTGWLLFNPDRKGTSQDAVLPPAADQQWPVNKMAGQKPAGALPGIRINRTSSTVNGKHTGWPAIDAKKPAPVANATKNALHGQSPLGSVKPALGQSAGLQNHILIVAQGNDLPLLPLKENKLSVTADMASTGMALNPVADLQTDICPSVTAIIKTDTGTAATQKIVREEKMQPAADSMTNQSKVMPLSKGWSFTVCTSAGLAGFSNYFLGITSNARYENVFSASPSSVGSATPPTGTGSTPAALKKGFSFAAGAEMSKKLNQKLSATAGFRYSYFSTKQHTGEAVQKDTVFTDLNGSASVNKFYLNSGSGNSSATFYTNQYHYLELPVGIEYKPFKKLPLLTGAGISAGYLLVSNALHYNSSKGIYYQNRELLQRTNFSLFAQAAYRIFSWKKAALYTGPQVQAALRNITTYNAAYTKHLYSASLKISVKFLK